MAHIIMGRMFKILTVCVLLVPTHSLSKQNDDLVASTSEDITQTKVQLSRQVPDGLLFMQILDLVRRLGSSPDESAVELVQSEMDLDENEARDFIYLRKEQPANPVFLLQPGRKSIGYWMRCLTRWQISLQNIFIY